MDYDGHISRRGDTHARSLLYEAAVVGYPQRMRDWTARKKAGGST